MDRSTLLVRNELPERTFGFQSPPLLEPYDHGIPLVPHNNDSQNRGYHHVRPDQRQTAQFAATCLPEIYGEPPSAVRDDQSQQKQRHHHHPLLDMISSIESSTFFSHSQFRGLNRDHNGVKLEDPAIIVPSQTTFYGPSSSSSSTSTTSSAPCLSQHTGLPVQHTDDAASKETQYLRRRCFNCHTTEPPSWRRSTLNPGKIVCNKCGLYERTHLRPRPRFDELRRGSLKARKQSEGTTGGGVIPKKAKMGALVKTEPRYSRLSHGNNNIA